MVTKVYVVGNYITVDDGQALTGLAKNVLFQKVKTVGAESYYAVINLPGRAASNLIAFSDLRKQNNTVYTVSEWETFITEKTGKSELDVMPEAAYTALTNKENKLYFTY